MIVKCSHCGHSLDLPGSFALGETKCAQCGETVVIPEPSQVTVVLKPRAEKPASEEAKALAAAAPPVAAKENYNFLAPPQGADEVGRLGVYRVLKVLGSGGMGVVFHAEDLHLRRAVALKCLLPALATSAAARQRFMREAQAAAAIEHDHIVVIYQVGEDRGVPFLAMQLLQGESLEDRLDRVGKLPVAEVLRIGREIAAGLAAAHDCGLIHRDIKPANIWLEGRQSRVKLLDFGLARAVADSAHMTQAGTIMGTPAYMSPEQARGEEVDSRCDLFSLGCVLYRMATGQYCFSGRDPLSTLLAVTTKIPQSPRALSTNLPAELSELIMALLAKDPAERPATADAVVDAIATIEVDPNLLNRNAPPDTQGPIKGATMTGPQRTQKIVREPERGTMAASPAQLGALPPAALAPTGQKARPGRRRLLILAGIVVAAVTAGAVLLPPLLSRFFATPDAGPVAASGDVQIGIAYGTETKKWLHSAVSQFEKSDQGKHIKIKLIPMGSLEGGEAVWKNEDQRIHVWSPASSLYKETLVQHWQEKHGRTPILKEADLALTPMVFVMWEDRYQAFIKKYKTISFTTIRQAVNEKDGWNAIAKQPDWGTFQFGHTDPAKSNSGLMTLLLMAHEFYKKKAQLTVAEVTNADFRDWLAGLEKGAAPWSPSTGTLMEDMVRLGPSSFDALMVYENVVIDYFKAAEGRSGELHVAYPPCNLWSEHPYYILDVPWSNKEQRVAAEAFLQFLLSEPIQKEALQHGFRPVNIEIPIRNVADSPFVRYKSFGIEVDMKSLCEPPREALLDNLLGVWDKFRKGG